MRTSDSKPRYFLGDYLFSDSPARLLVVGDVPEALLSQPLAGVSVDRLDNLREAEALSARVNSDTSTNMAVPESLVLQLKPELSGLEQRLGRAARAFPHRVLVHFQISNDSEGPSDEVFFALGFRRLVVVPDSDHPAHTARWFEYRLSRYKASPTWLNARFWANPERFDTDDEPDIYCDESDEDHDEQ